VVVLAPLGVGDCVCDFLEELGVGLEEYFGCDRVSCGRFGGYGGWRKRRVRTYEREYVTGIRERPLRDVVDVEMVSVCRVSTDDFASFDRVPVLAERAERGVDARESTREFLLLPGVARQWRPIPAGVLGG